MLIQSADWRDSLRFILIITGLIGYPLVSLISLNVETDSRMISVGYRACIFFLSIFVFSVDCFKNRKYFLSNRYFQCFLMIWVILSCRFIYDVVFLHHKPSAYFDDLDFFLFFMGVSFIPTLSLFKPIPLGMLEKLHKFLIILLIILTSIYSIKFLNSEAGIVRHQTDSLNAITYGSLGAMLILLMSTYKLKIRFYILRIIIYCSSISLGFWVLITAASKGPLIALLLAILPLAINAWRYNFLFRVSTIFAVIVCPFFLIGIVFFAENDFNDNYLLNRLLSFNEDSSTDERIYLIKASWNIFLDNPIFGGAIVEPLTLGYSHNIILESLMVGGVGMGGLIIFILIKCTHAGIILINKTGEQSFLGAIIIFSTVMAMISGSLYTGPEFWSVFALAIAYNPRLQNQQ